MSYYYLGYLHFFQCSSSYYRLALSQSWNIGLTATAIKLEMASPATEPSDRLMPYWKDHV